MIRAQARGATRFGADRGSDMLRRAACETRSPYFGHRVP
jgi:hypothetical protein